MSARARLRPAPVGKTALASQAGVCILANRTRAASGGLFAGERASERCARRAQDARAVLFLCARMLFF